MRIAVTYENGGIFQHFGHTEQFKLYDVEDGKVARAVVVDTNGSGHGALASFLRAFEVDAASAAVPSTPWPWRESTCTPASTAVPIWRSCSSSTAFCPSAPTSGAAITTTTARAMTAAPTATTAAATSTSAASTAAINI